MRLKIINKQWVIKITKYAEDDIYSDISLQFKIELSYNSNQFTHFIVYLICNDEQHGIDVEVNKVATGTFTDKQIKRIKVNYETNSIKEFEEYKKHIMKDFNRENTLTTSKTLVHCSSFDVQQEILDEYQCSNVYNSIVNAYNTFKTAIDEDVHNI